MTSFVVAKIMGYSLVVLGLGVLANGQRYKNIFDALKQNDVLRFFLGLVVMVFGVILVTVHNIWVSDWRLLVTVLSWSILIKGAFYVLLPGIAAKIVAAKSMGTNLYRVSGLINLVLGIVLIVLSCRCY